MPILSSNENPPSRLPEKQIVDSNLNWWIAKVKPRQEKAFAKDLIEMGIEYYLPYYVKTSPRADSNAMRKSLLPLFPSYVPFACEKEPWFLLRFKRVSTILDVKAQKKFKQELNQIYLVNEKKIRLFPAAVKSDYKIGENVQIAAGPLLGIYGKIIRIKKLDHLLLKVDGLGEACLSIDSRYVKTDIETGRKR